MMCVFWCSTAQIFCKTQWQENKSPPFSGLEFQVTRFQGISEMKRMNYSRVGRLSALALSASALLTACKPVLLFPSGDIAAQQGHLIVVSTILMLLIIVPVIFLTLLFAWRYRHNHTRDDYQPEWDHSLRLELVIWAAPLLIVIALGAITWMSTHTLDPFRRVSRIDANRALAPTVKPVVIDVVALDWKWLFIYPEQGVASVNELALPVDVPVQFHITSESVMNSFFVPALAGQIYAMPGMEAQLNAILNQAGSYQGLSANYSGAGFSHMRFAVKGLTANDFQHWLDSTKTDTGVLNKAGYLALRAPSIANPVQHFGSVDPHMFDAIVHRCIDATHPCPTAFCLAQS